LVGKKGNLLKASHLHKNKTGLDQKAASQFVNPARPRLLLLSLYLREEITLSSGSCRPNGVIISLRTDNPLDSTGSSPIPESLILEVHPEAEDGQGREG